VHATPLTPFPPTHTCTYPQYLFQRTTAIEDNFRFFFEWRCGQRVRKFFASQLFWNVKRKLGDEKKKAD